MNALISQLAGSATRPSSGMVDDKEFVRSIEKGLSALRVLSEGPPLHTVTQIAAETGLSRAAARRVVLTLQEVGYVGTNGRDYFLLPRVLELGYAYLSSSGLSTVAQPILDEFNRDVGEACSIGVLSDRDVIYIARSQGRRVMTMSLGIGTRLDAVPTAVGRVLLAALPEESLDVLLRSVPVIPHTPLTVTDPDTILRLVADIRQQGWAISDQELELGIRTASAPVRDVRGDVVAAVNVATHSSRISLEQLADDLLPKVIAAAREIEDKLNQEAAG